MVGRAGETSVHRGSFSKLSKGGVAWEVVAVEKRDHVWGRLGDGRDHSHGSGLPLDKHHHFSFTTTSERFHVIVHLHHYRFTSLLQHYCTLVWRFRDVTLSLHCG